jgi:creatinine amidohydrolase
MLKKYADIRVAVINEYDFCFRTGREIVVTEGDSHAGEVETARIMHLHPGLVKGTSPREFPDFPEFILVRNKTAYWPGGVWGDPSAATPEKGEQLVRLTAEALAEFVKNFETFTER